jgi:hypothetical protein
MKITPVPHGLNLALSTAPRTAGLHMSDLYNSLYQELEPKRYVKGSAPDKLRMEAGLALEEVLEEGLKRRLGERPGEFVTKDEGIIFTPDLIIYETVTRLGEIKLTWMSSRDVPRVSATAFHPKFAKYLTQMKCYGHHLELPQQRLLAFFVNGDYRPPRPELLAWDIEFTAREMRDEWTMVKNHGKHAGLIV